MWRLSLTKRDIRKIDKLNQYHFARKRIQACLERVKELKNDLYFGDLKAQRITGMPRGCGDGDRIEKILNEIERLKRQELKSIAEAERFANEIVQAVESLDDQLLKFILELRYLERDAATGLPLTWEQIAARIGKGIRQTIRLHEKAIKNLVIIIDVT